MADNTRIGIDARRHVDGNDRHGSDGRGHIDFSDDGCYGLAQASVKACADHGIDDDGRGVKPFPQKLPVFRAFRCRQEQARFVVSQFL